MIQGKQQQLQKKKVGQNQPKRQQSQQQVLLPKRPRQRRAKQSLTMQGPSSVQMRSKKECVVEEDEYVAAVLGSVLFANTAFPKSWQLNNLSLVVCPGETMGEVPVRKIRVLFQPGSERVCH